MRSDLLGECLFFFGGFNEQAMEKNYYTSYVNWMITLWPVLMSMKIW